MLKRLQNQADEVPGAEGGDKDQPWREGRYRGEETHMNSSALGYPAQHTLGDPKPDQSRGKPFLLHARIVAWTHIKYVQMKVRAQ